MIKSANQHNQFNYQSNDKKKNSKIRQSKRITINDQCQQYVTTNNPQLSGNKQKQKQSLQGCNKPFDISQKVPHDLNFPQSSPSSCPSGLNGKKLQEQLKLFRFGQKIQQIQSQQIRNLIEQQIIHQKQKEQIKNDYILNHAHLYETSTYQKLHKNQIYKPSNYSQNKVNKGMTRYNNKIIARKYQFNLQNKIIHYHQNFNDILNYNSQIANKRKLSMSKQQKGHLGIDKAFKPSTSLPPWQRILFHDKLRMKQCKQKQKMIKDKFNLPHKSIFNLSEYDSKPNVTNYIQSLRHSLSMLQDKSLCIKKDYEFFIDKMKNSNSQVRKQLMEQLKNSERGQDYLMDKKKKSFSGYNKTKNILQNNKKNHQKRKTVCNSPNKQQQLYLLISDDRQLTGYRINYLKPLRINPSKHGKKHTFIPNQQNIPETDRPSNNNKGDNSSIGSEEDQYIYQQNQVSFKHQKFKDKYVKKIGSKQLQRFIAERRGKSRQTQSPCHHQLSAWN